MSSKTRSKFVLFAVFNMTFLQSVTTMVYAQASAESSRPAVKNEYIVKFKKPTGVRANALGEYVHAQARSLDVQVKSVYEETLMMHVKVASDAAKQELVNNPDIEFVEPNYILSVDPIEFGALRSDPISTFEYSQSGTDALTKVTASWNIQKNASVGVKTIVAIIDTGLTTDHPVFKESGAVWANTKEINGQPGVDDDGNGYVDDKYGWNFLTGTGNNYDDSSSGHGTHVAGIVLGVGQDIFANPAKESKVKIMSLKGLNSKGAGDTSTLITAMYYAVKNGAKVINNSWGGGGYSQSLHEAYTYAFQNGVVVATAAGNTRTNNDASPAFPANLDTPSNISVASSDSRDMKSDFSNFGQATVTLAAPGDQIYSTMNKASLECNFARCFGTLSGTSMAAPFVAGVAALVLREAPQLTGNQVKSLIIGSSDILPAWSNLVTSSGRVNVYKAITSAKAAVSTAPWKPSYDPDYKGKLSALGLDDGTQAGGCGLVKAISDSEAGTGGGSAAPVSDLLLVFTLFFMPLILALILRGAQPADKKNYSHLYPALLRFLTGFTAKIKLNTL